MKDFIKKTIVTIASLIVFIAGAASHCESVDNFSKDSQKYIWYNSEWSINTKISDYITSKATVVNLRDSFRYYTSIDTHDWKSGNYTDRPIASLNDFYVEAEKSNFSGGAGIRTFPTSDGLVGALQDIEYQFFPVDAKDPLKMRWIGVPSVWLTLNSSRSTYFNIIWYETHWSKISPEIVPELIQKELENPKGNLGHSLFTSFGTKIDELLVEVGFIKGWSSWPSEEENTSTFSPNPYKYTAAYFKFRENYDILNLTGTTLVKHCEENAGSILNSQISIDKELQLWNNPVEIGTSFFFVQSFLQSNHLRTSPWEDLGNSISFWAYMEDKGLKRRFGIEQVLNPEEYGIYLTGFAENWISVHLKARTQINFFYDKQKHISEQYDSFRFFFYGIITF